MTLIRARRVSSEERDALHQKGSAGPGPNSCFGSEGPVGTAWQEFTF